MKSANEFKANFYIFTLESHNNSTMHAIRRSQISKIKVLRDVYTRLTVQNLSLYSHMLGDLIDFLTIEDIAKLEENNPYTHTLPGASLRPEAKKIIMDWLSQNHDFIEVEAHTYWDGGSWNYLITSCGDNIKSDVNEVSDKVYEEIYNELYVKEVKCVSDVVMKQNTYTSRMYFGEKYTYKANQSTNYISDFTVEVEGN